MPDPRVALALIFGVAMFCFGWKARDWKADAELADYRAGLAAAAQDQRTLAAKVEAAQAATATDSTLRLDTQAAQRETEIRYVDREVIQYRDRWRASTCRLPAEWLQLYNRSLGTADGAVSGPADL